MKKHLSLQEKGWPVRVSFWGRYENYCWKRTGGRRGGKKNETEWGLKKKKEDPSFFRQKRKGSGATESLRGERKNGHELVKSSFPEERKGRHGGKERFARPTLWNSLKKKKRALFGGTEEGKGKPPGGNWAKRGGQPGKERKRGITEGGEELIGHRGGEGGCPFSRGRGELFGGLKKGGGPAISESVTNFFLGKGGKRFFRPR